MRPAHLLLGILVSVSSVSHAEIEKIAVPSATGVSFFWWPKLSVIQGWHQDHEQSRHYGFNALAPDGSTFNEAKTVMYAKAIYKPRDPEIKSLAALIQRDKDDFTQNVPGVAIKEVASIATGDGLQLKSFTFSPKGNGNWERVSYGEEGEFFIIFTVSSRSSAGLNEAKKFYEKLISGYKKSP